MNAFRAFLISSVNDRKSLRLLSLSLCVKRQTDHENRKLDEKKKEEWIPGLNGCNDSSPESVIIACSRLRDSQVR